MEDVMEYTERDLRVNSVGYESLVWVNDEQGKEYSCSIDRIRGGIKSFNDLTDRERASCVNVNSIVGTERW